jgi:hypothetical protein
MKRGVNCSDCGCDNWRSDAESYGCLACDKVQGKSGSSGSKRDPADVLAAYDYSMSFGAASSRMPPSFSELASALRSTLDQLRDTLAENQRLRLGLEIVASDPWPCINAIQATAKRCLEGGQP